jgi:hypothetical protein
MSGKEAELARDEIEASWNWRRGSVDETFPKMIEVVTAEL